MIIRLFLTKWQYLEFEKKNLFFFLRKKNKLLDGIDNCWIFFFGGGEGKWIFFSNSKYCQFVKRIQQSWNLQTGNFRIKTNNFWRICQKKQHLMIFDDFGKIFDFWPNLGFFETNLWVFQIFGNRQTQKKFSSGRKMHVNYNSYR